MNKAIEFVTSEEGCESRLTLTWDGSNYASTVALDSVVSVGVGTVVNRRTQVGVAVPLEQRAAKRFNTKAWSNWIDAQRTSWQSNPFYHFE